MTQLVQGMYADYSCNLFGLRYDQQRRDEVIRNANWYNDRGQKIGQGDLNIRDIYNILMNIHSNEAFFVLSEADGNWNLPEGKDRFEPGIPYVMEHCRWVVTGAMNVLNAFNIRERVIEDSISVESKFVTHLNPDFEHREVTRNWIKNYLVYYNGKIEAIKEPVTVQAMYPKNWYGLDVYHMSDGKRWAVEADMNLAHSAARLKVLDNLWQLNSSYFKLYGEVSTIELEMIESLVQLHKKASNDFIKKIVGNKTDDVIREYLMDYAPRRVLNPNYTRTVYVEGLPPNHMAYRIDDDIPFNQ